MARGFKAILVERGAYLLSLCRCVERNPVAANLVSQPQDLARDQSLLWAYRFGGMAMTQLAAAAALSVTHVDRLIAREEQG